MTHDPDPVYEEVADLLHRRSELSTFLVHYTRALSDGSTAKNNLISILTSHTIEARSVYGIMKDRAQGDPALAETQRCVCFTETPLEHAWMMCRPIRGRAHNFGPYGIAFTKAWARREGANPIWYIDQTKEYGHDWLTHELDSLRDVAIAGHSYAFRDYGEGVKLYKVSLPESPIARIAPFIEQMMPQTSWGTPKEFWWEREWRHVGSLIFPWSRVVAAFAPEGEHDEIEMALRVYEKERSGGFPEDPPPKLLDPKWGLERMIARLAGVPDRDAGPFPK